MARTKLSPPPIRTPFTGAYGSNKGSVGVLAKQVSTTDGQQTPTWPWARWFLDAHGTITHPALPLPPATSSAKADGGEIVFDTNFVYIAVGKNQWKRAPLANF